MNKTENTEVNKDLLIPTIPTINLYSNNYNNLDSFVIDLGTEKSGYYIIMIEYSNLLLVGNFTL